MISRSDLDPGTDWVPPSKLETPMGMLEIPALPTKLYSPITNEALKHVSFSQIANSWLGCQTAWANKYLKKKQTTVGWAALLGGVVDNTVTDYYMTKLEEGSDTPTVDQTVTNYQKRFETLVDAVDAGEETGYDLDLAAMELNKARGEKMLVKYLEEYGTATTPLRTQIMYRAKLHPDVEWEIIGAPDYELERNGGALLCDLKTGSQVWSPIKASKSFQPNLYYLLSLLLGTTPEGFEFHSVSYGAAQKPDTIKTKFAVVPTSRSLVNINATIGLISSMVNKVVSTGDMGHFEPAGPMHPYCSLTGCTFYKTCPHIGYTEKDVEYAGGIQASLR